MGDGALKSATLIQASQSHSEAASESSGFSCAVGLPAGFSVSFFPQNFQELPVKYGFSPGLSGPAAFLLFPVAAVITLPPHASQCLACAEEFM